MRIELKRLDDAFHFEAKNEEGNSVQMDSSPAIEGQRKGIGPMQLLLAGLGGCSAIDVVSILKKQRQEVEDFKISIDGEREKDKEPSLFETIHVHFQLKGNLNKDKVARAIDLSMDTYCSVAKTLEKTAKITHSFSINEQQ